MGAGIERAGFGLVTIDPAGGGANGDETGMAAGYSVAGNIHVPWVGGFPGGYELHKLHLIRDTLVELVRKGFPLRKIIIEKNFGYGAFQAVLEPVIRAIEKELGPVGIDEDYVSGQKERRIIDTLEPVVSRGSLIIHDTAVAANNLTLEYHSPEKRGTYCVFHQLAGISSVRDALVHDDRLDALEALVRHLQPQLSDKDSKRDDQEHLRRLLAAVRPPGGRPPSRARSILDRYRRK
jgi:hypothetical protein